MMIIALMLALVENKPTTTWTWMEYVADANECDQQPYGERDKATSPESKVGEQILQSPAKDQPNW